MRTTRRYFGCCTRRVTSTTIVFSIFALVTLPVGSVLSLVTAAGFFVSGVIVSALCLLQLMRAEKRPAARQIFVCVAQALERFGLPGCQLKPQPEDLFAQILLLRFELVYSCFTNLFHALGHAQKPPARVTNFVGIGSLCAARSSA